MGLLQSWLEIMVYFLLFSKHFLYPIARYLPKLHLYPCYIPTKIPLVIPTVHQKKKKSILPGQMQANYVLSLVLDPMHQLFGLVITPLRPFEVS